MNNQNRNWIIIDDDVDKAHHLIAYILHRFPQEGIAWFWPVIKPPLFPTFIQTKGEDGRAVFSTELCLPDAEAEDRFEGEIYFFECPNIEVFSERMACLRDWRGIMLLDVKMPAFGNQASLDRTLIERSRAFLPDTAEGREHENIITLISNVSFHEAVKSSIREGDRRILTAGNHNWLFSPTHIKRNCWSVIEESHQHWRTLYQSETMSLEDFLENMARFDQHECHNWENDTPSKLLYYKSRGRWDEAWDMPKQLAHLIKLLQYDREEFLRLFGLRNENGHFANGSAICECLKVMGTKAKREDPKSNGGLSFSILGILLVCWAVYREEFKTSSSKADHKFIQAIRSAEGNTAVARYALVTPPQTNASLRQTILAFREMMKTMLKSTRQQDAGQDNLQDIKLDETGLAVRLKINPEKLFPKLQDEYAKRYLNKKTPGGGDTCQKIFNFMELASYCDDYHLDKMPFLGPAYELKIFAAGEDAKHGIILKFANGQPNQPHYH